MLHPSYKEMFEKVNVERTSEESEIKSRYTLVLACAKRARQINAGSEPLVELTDRRERTRNLSIAVSEMYAGKFHVLGDIDNFEENMILDEEGFAEDLLSDDMEASEKEMPLDDESVDTTDSEN